MTLEEAKEALEYFKKNPTKDLTPIIGPSNFEDFERFRSQIVVGRKITQPTQFFASEKDFCIYGVMYDPKTDWFGSRILEYPPSKPRQ